MNELICMALFVVAFVVLGFVTYATPKIIDYIKSFIKWHRHMDIDDI